MSRSPQNTKLFGQYVKQIRERETTLSFFEWKVESGFAKKEDYINILVMI